MTDNKALRTHWHKLMAESMCCGKELCWVGDLLDDPKRHKQLNPGLQIVPGLLNTLARTHAMKAIG